MKMKKIYDKKSDGYPSHTTIIIKKYIMLMFLYKIYKYLLFFKNIQILIFLNQNYYKYF